MVVPGESDPRRRKSIEAVAQLLLRRLPLTLAALLLLGAVAISFANVIARYLFLASIYWADEAMVFLVIWSIFLAAVAVTYDGRHLTMDLFSARLSPRWRRVLNAIIVTLCLLIFLFMAWQAATVVRTLVRNDQRSIALDMPIAVPHAALLVGFALCAVAVLLAPLLRRRPPDAVEDAADRVA